ncbi:hypothetical protein LR48_Vigan01g145600 [Vigna angularis]|uniref:Uncharacterized protein n=1 Tax=Phaseolus angularis TaxID=3914 RepID=A0A0L9TMW2_PHAAN|nr:hypothetical protein LR48_Vigan01g145600 [Vigna angularis]
MLDVGAAKETRRRISDTESQERDYSLGKKGQTFRVGRSWTVEPEQASEGSKQDSPGGSITVSNEAPLVQMVHTVDLLPFTQAIMETPMPERWMPPTFEKYDGSTDPNEHFKMFVK